MIVLTPYLQSLLASTTLRLVSCWKITRTDATVIKVTDHDGDLYLDQAGAEVYKAASGFSASARQQQPDLSVHNMEVVGIIDNELITDSDLRGGRYRNAEVIEQVVDWKFPWAGAFLTRRYFIDKIVYENGHWNATFVGISKKLKGNIGEVYTRNCGYRLGDPNTCKVDLTSFTFTGTVGSSVTSGKQFTSNLTQADEYYQFGTIIWLTGDNAGMSFDVRHFAHTDGEFILWLPCPYPVTTGDTFTAVRGCNKTADECKSIFSNLVNHGGFPTIPGSDLLYQTPNFKT